jgi:hypothetical protein
VDINRRKHHKHLVYIRASASTGICPRILDKFGDK